MLTLRQAALLKVAQGRTTLEEVRRCVPNVPPPHDAALSSVSPTPDGRSPNLEHALR
jgi:hypothetical protein